MQEGRFYMFNLYKNDNVIMCSDDWKNLVRIVNELKTLNKKFIDRRNFVVKNGNKILYSWKRK